MGSTDFRRPITLGRDPQPGIVSFTAPAWGRLFDRRQMPAGEAPASAADCYRFALSHPAVDVSMAGPRNLDEMPQGLAALETRAPGAMRARADAP